MSRDRESWLRWLATTCSCLCIRPDYLYYDGYCTEHDVLDIKLRMQLQSYTKKTPPSKGRALGHSEAANVQLKLEFL